jgi:nickel transport protein
METVPLFAVTNQEGLPILASVPNPQDKTKKVQIATFFVSQQDAQTLVTNLKTNKPDVGKVAKVAPVSLRQAYELVRKNQTNKENLVFQFLPAQQQVDSALAVLKQNGQQVKEFNGIPLFYAIGGQDKGLLTIEQGKNKIIPFYFSQKDLQGMLDQLKQQKSPLSSTAKIQVTTLDQVVNSLLKENGAAISEITFVPSREAINYVMQQQQSAPNSKTTPQPAKAAPNTPTKK